MALTFHNLAQRSIWNAFLAILLLCGGMALLVLIYLVLAWYTSASRRSNGRGAPNDGNPSGTKGGHGLSKSDIQKLPTVVCSNTHHKNGDGVDEEKGSDELCSTVDDLECAVCLEQFQNGDTCLLMPSCKHCFHVDCAGAWLTKRSICPVCRRSALPKHDDEDHQDQKHQEQEPNFSNHSPDSAVIDMPS